MPATATDQTDIIVEQSESNGGVVASKHARGAPVPPRAAAAKGVEVALFAPYNDTVQLVGDWTDWRPIEMRKGDDGWWRVRAELPDGDYLYKFRVKSKSYFAADQWVDVFDPYAMSVTNDGNENTVLRVRDGKRVDVAYDWKHDAVPLPENHELVIYELHVGDFAGARHAGGDAGSEPGYARGQFRHVIERLDYLHDLGVNCIELLPVKEFPGKGWGYSLRSLFAVENSYGSPEDLCRLVDEAHARGMRVVIDGVYNHADADSPLAKINYEYWFYNPNPDPDEMQWGPKFNFSHFDQNLEVFPARKYVIESIQFWVETFHIDGIRFDATRAIRDFDILRELADAAYAKIEGIKPFFTVAEHVPEDPAITGRPGGGPVDAAWHDCLARLLQAVITRLEVDGNRPENLDALATCLDPAKNGYGTGGRLVNFIGNHDFHRILHLLGNDAKVFDEAAFRRVKLGTALLLTAPGIPMLWMGQEFGFSSEKSLEPRPLDWNLLKNQRNTDLLEFHKRLIRGRRDHDALRADSFQPVLVDNERLLFGFKRWTEGGGVAVVVANLKDDPAGDVEVRDVGLEDGTWHELIGDYETRVEGGVLRDRLDRSEVKVFVKQP